METCSTKPRLSRLFGSIAIAFLMAFAVACDQGSSMPTVTKEGDWVTYDNDSFLVEAPAHWEIDYSGRVGTTFILFSPEDSVGDSFRENVNLIQEFVDGHEVTLESYTEEAIDILKEYMTDLQDLSVEERTDGFWLSYNGLQGQYRMQMRQRIIMKNEVVYIITYTTKKDSGSLHDQYADAILASFKLK